MCATTRSIHSIPKSAKITPFIGPKPAILHLFFFFLLNSKNVRKISNVFINSITDFLPFKKNVVSSAYAFYRIFFFKNIKGISIFILYDKKKNVIAKTSVDTYAEIGLICLVPLLHLK